MVGTEKMVRPFAAVFLQDPMISSSKSRFITMMRIGAIGTTLASLCRQLSLISDLTVLFFCCKSPLFLARRCHTYGSKSRVAFFGNPHMVIKRMWVSSQVPKNSGGPVGVDIDVDVLLVCVGFWNWWDMP